jgi:hypothetical protein
VSFSTSYDDSHSSTLRNTRAASSFAGRRPSAARAAVWGG